MKKWFKMMLFCAIVSGICCFAWVYLGRSDGTAEIWAAETSAAEINVAETEAAETEAAETKIPVAEEVEQKVFLKGVEPVVGIPDELLIEYEGTKEYYPVKSVEFLGERWEDSFEFPVLFYVYDANDYQLGEIQVPRRENPGLLEYEKELLQVMGLKGEDYTVEEVVWDGDVYSNDEGILCRDALARGRKRVEDYEVLYGGTVERIVSIEEGEQTKMQLMEAAVIEPEPEVSDPLESIWKVVRRVLAITVAFWMVILLVVLLVLVMRWVKMRKNKQCSEK